MSSSKVWSRISATRKSDGALLKFCFQEATATEKEDVVNFLEKYLICKENFNKVAGTSNSKESNEEMLGLFNMIYDDCHIMICYEDTESAYKPIVGLSLIALDKEGDEDILPQVLSQVRTPEVKKMLNILQVTEELCNGRKKLGLDKYYSGRGVCVHPEYSGLGIATELLQLRRVVSKEHEVPATGAWMTAIGSQKAAERDGWKTLFEIPFDELGRLTGCDFDGAPPTCKLMVVFTETEDKNKDYK